VMFDVADGLGLENTICVNLYIHHQSKNTEYSTSVLHAYLTSLMV
jgi:hypothetical protein